MVDDAIVVVENVERNLERGLAPLDAARVSMDEVSGALVAIMLVLCAVFVPTFFLTGLSGAFYKQFALTISAATVVSLVVSLTLSPALAALLLRHEHSPRPQRGVGRALYAAAEAFNSQFDRLSEGYGRLIARLITYRKTMMVAYGALIVGTVEILWITPTGFVPAQDQSYLITIIQLPPGASLARSDAVLQQVSKRILTVAGVRGTIMLAGYNAASDTSAPNSATIFVPLNPFDQRKTEELSANNILAEARKRVADIDEARVLVIPPPLIDGIGSAGGYRMMLQDRSGHGYKELAVQSDKIIAQANATPGLAQVFTFFDTATPRIYADIDRPKADMLGVPPERVFETLQVYLGSAYVNDFNLLGRTFQVIAQADQSSRRTESDIANLKTRSVSGAMVPIGSVATFRDEAGPYRVVRYNLFPAVEVDGDTAPGYSTGRSLATMEKLAAEQLPPVTASNGRPSHFSRRLPGIRPAWCSSSPSRWSFWSWQLSTKA